MLNITKLPVGELEANCFLIADDKKNAVIIDPGAEASYILDVIRQQELKPLAILLTHAHFDHFGAAADVMEETGIPLYVHTLDKPMVISAEYSLAVHLGYGADYRCPDESMIRTFEEGDELKFSEELTFTVLHTPGHSPGSCCFRHESILFSGDTLFRDGVGRVDFQGGNIRDMRASLARLGAIEGDCTVYCGHFADTTLEHERQFGHYLIPQKL
ncbi:MAG: MBL fold metallo-hydrolase [Oscillospiraceae bacterium]|nr:MBL fold metallo-hydrolase [Oscillospiraceae bacterium]